MRGYQCLKQIHLTVHHPQFEAPITPDKQKIFDQGNHVGALAQDLFPGGVLVDNAPWDFVGSLKKTRELLSAETPVIYEASFEFMGCYARTDIIRFIPDTQRWSIYEVKSSVQIKIEQLQDISLQAWILAKSGLPIENIHLVYLNRECVYPDLSNLFVIEDVTEKVREYYPKIQKEVAQIVDAIKAEDIPEIDIGPHCLSPYECGFKKHCFQQAKVPEISVFNLPQIRDKMWEYYRRGQVSLEQIKDEELNKLQSRIVKAHTTKQDYFETEQIKQKLEEWQFPIGFIDFETINPAVPEFQSCRPYSQVPFQFSLHCLESNGEIKHFEFLWDKKSDPRPELIKSMLAAVKGLSTLVAYYSQFEVLRIKEMAEAFPDYKIELISMCEKFHDPLPLIREHIYMQKFHGSFSLKKVAPALLGDDGSYEDLAVADGTAAQRAYELLLSTENIERKNQTRDDLLKYCKQDTEVLVDLYKLLTKASGDE